MRLSYAIVGEGRMGRAIDAIATGRGHLRCATATRASGLAPVLDARPDVAFEFTEPGVAADNVRRLAAAGIDVVCGTTGWRPDAALHAALASGGGGLLVEPNFSIGVQLYLRLVREAARLAARLDSHEPAIVEAHHRAKRDAPSGTAARMAALVGEADPRVRRVEHGRPQGAPPAGTLPVASIRSGHEPGRHELRLDGPHDRILLEHAARGRDGFALGAVRAAEWLRGRRGLATLEDLIDAQLGPATSGTDEGERT